jgi:hypothetical protein
MGFIRTLARAAILWGQENALDVLSAVVLPCTNSAVTRMLGRTPSRWITRNLWNVRTVDGAILGGLAPAQSGAKYTLPKGLPKASSRVLAIENEPHTVDGFNGVIASGYGIGTKMFLSRMNYHFHEADKAGPHFDLVVADVPPGTTQWELNIPRGDYKGRYAFITTEKGVIVIPMNDEGLALEKPSYSLRPTEFLEQVGRDNTKAAVGFAERRVKDVIVPALPPQQWIVEHKLDGSLANFTIGKGRAVFHSHRPTGETYYDRIPHLEDLHNHSRFFTSRKLMPYPDLDGTVGKVELYHPDGVGRVAGILNALPERAQEIQQLRGPATAHCWDLVKYKGKDVSGLPYVQRRYLAEKVIDEIRFFNSNWNMVRACKPGEDPIAFYNEIVSLPLPFGEGVVVKAAGDPAGGTWFKVKQVDFADLELVEVLPGTGKYSDSVGRLVVRNPENGALGEVGSFAITDERREWIWTHRENVVGAVVKIRVQEITDRGAPRAGVFMDFHEGKGPTEAGLLMYAESLAGADPEETTRIKYKLISSAGWRR